MKRLAKSLLLVWLLGLGAFYPSVVWSQNCADCSVQSGIIVDGCTDISCVYCGDADDNFGDSICIRMRQYKDFHEVEALFNRCVEERKVTKYKDINDFFTNARCTSLGNFTNVPDISARDYAMSRLKDYDFFDFYQALIKDRAKKSKDSNYDQLKEVIAMMNAPNKDGETLLDFMEEFYDIHRDNVFIEGYMKRMHRVACIFGAVYRKHPELNKDCLARRKSKYID